MTNKKPPNMYLVETVGRAIPCFRHGTDYILNLLFVQVLRRLMRIVVLPDSQVCFRILVLPWLWQPISRYTAVELLHIPLGIALSRQARLRFHR
jgi:predicted small integral membrane protein